MASWYKTQYRLLLEQLDICFKAFSLPQQRLLHQLLEKHLLVFATSAEDYGFTKAINPPIHKGGAPLNYPGIVQVIQ